MNPTRGFAIGAFLLVMTTACGHIQGYLDIARSKGISEEYLQALRYWTRSQTVYSEFETKVHIQATLRSPEFNRAYHREYARIYQLDADEQTQSEKVKYSDPGEFTEFVFYAYVPNKTENDFDRSRSIWSIFLIDAGAEKIKPSEVRRIEPVSPILTEFFPYGNPHYGTFYNLRFPRHVKAPGKAGPFKLVFVSVSGKIELEFVEK